MLVSGDVHMAQILRKDCLRSSDVVALALAADDGDGSEGRHTPRTRPLVEITTSGMTHSWGTSFSSQLKNHRLPLKPYAYLVSWTFMTICHLVCPWYDIVFRVDSGEPGGGGEGSAGLQYELVAKTPTSNRVCANCSVCKPGTYRRFCDGVKNSTCQV